MRKWVAPVVAALAAAVVSVPPAQAAACATPTGECLEVRVIDGGICWNPQRFCPVSVVVDRAYREDIRILLSTVDGTAVAGRDFAGLSDTPVIIPSGATSARLEIPLLRTATVTRSFGVEIRRPSAGLVTKARTEVVIRT